MSQLVKVLLAEGHQPIKDIIIDEVAGLKNVRLLGCVHSGEDLVGYLRTTDEYPEIILMDADIDQDVHFNYTKTITAEFPEIKVIVLATRDDSLYIRNMLKSGASDYLLKESCADGLNKLLTRHECSQDTQINFEYTSGPVLKSERKPDGSLLNQREREVLKLMMNQYSSLEIREKLSMNRTEIHDTMDRVNQKTNSSNQADLRRYAITHSIY